MKCSGVHRFLTAELVNIHGSTISLIKTGNRICSHGIYTANAQEDKEYDHMLVMTTTSRRTSPPMMLSQRRDRRSGLFQGLSALFGVIDSLESTQ